MFLQPNDSLIRWQDEEPQIALVTIPACFTHQEWEKYYVAAYYSKRINQHSHKNRNFTEEHAFRLACSEDCDLIHQRMMMKKGLCNPLKKEETPIGELQALVTKNLS